LTAYTFVANRSTRDFFPTAVQAKCVIVPPNALRAEDAVREVTDFYRVYHSSRIVGDDLVFRLTRPLTDDNVKDIQQRFEDLLKGPLDQSPGPLPLEQSELPALPRLIVPFNRSSYARLRRLIDYINTL
jgi:hypothetical protein